MAPDRPHRRCDSSRALARRKTATGTFHYAELTDVRDAIKALWTRHEALHAKNILAPHRVLPGRRTAHQELLNAPDQACTAAGFPAAFHTTCAAQLFET